MPEFYLSKPKFIKLCTENDIKEANLGTLEDWTTFIGGQIEIINISDTELLVVNENGKRLGMPTNEEASKIYGNTIAGNVAFVIGLDIDFL